jgi:hypothetical protein
MNLSTAEPDDFEADHFPTCPAYNKGECNCDEQEIDMRDVFAEMRRDLERGK